MIVKYEVEQFCKEIEEKLPTLEGKAYENAVNKLGVLERVNNEFMELEDLMRKHGKSFLVLKGDWLLQKKQILELTERVSILENVIEELKDG